jgi:hypothetical protein
MLPRSWVETISGMLISLILDVEIHDGKARWKSSELLKQDRWV